MVQRKNVDDVSKVRVQNLEKHLEDQVEDSEGDLEDEQDVVMEEGRPRWGPGKAGAHSTY